MKVINRSHRYDKSNSRPRHRRRSTKYKTCLGMIMLVCVKHHPSNI